MKIFLSIVFVVLFWGLAVEMLRQADQIYLGILRKKRVDFGYRAIIESLSSGCMFFFLGLAVILGWMPAEKLLEGLVQWLEEFLAWFQ